MRNVTVLLSVLVLASACKKTDDKPKETAPPPPAPKPTSPEPAKPTAMTGEQLGAWWKQCMTAFSAKDEAKFTGCFADDTSSDFVESGMPPLTGGKAVVEGRAKMLWAAFPDVKAEPQIVLVSGGNWVSIDLLTGTNTGSFMGQPKTDKKMGNYMVHFGAVDLAASKPKAINGLMDLATLMGQLSGDKHARAVVDKGWPDAGRVVVAKDDEIERKHVAAWNAGTEGWNSHDAEKALAPYADDAVVRDVGAGDVVGKKAITEMMKGYWSGFSDLKGTYDTVWGAGDWVVAMGTAVGTNDGDLPSMKVKKTGKKVQMRLIELARFEGDKVKDHWLFYNGMTMATQLGLMPAPGAPAPGDKQGPGDKQAPGKSAAPAGDKTAPAPK